MEITSILPRLGNVKKTNNGWLGLCPGHPDKKQSLSLTETNGKILLNCFAGCDIQTIVSALGLSMHDLFLDKPGYQLQNVAKQKKIVAIYDYTDEKGNLLFQSVRYDPKGFTQRKPNGRGGFDYDLNGVRRVLYRLPEVLLSELVLIVEGEKDVEMIREKGFVATCNPQGALKWKDEYSEALRNKRAVILPDNDEPGRSFSKTSGFEALVIALGLALKWIDEYISTINNKKSKL